MPRIRCFLVLRVWAVEFSVSPASDLGGHDIGNASPGRANATRSDLLSRLVAPTIPGPTGEGWVPPALASTVTVPVTPTAVYVSSMKAGVGAPKETKMAMFTRSLLIATVALAATSAFAPAAWAGCGVDTAILKKHASWTTDGQDNARPIPVNFGQGAIVGMWSVTLSANGGTFDWGYQVWHGDGTEIMNSGSRAPATENFCLGVWAQTGPFSYKLNHFALSYDATGALNARVNIKENVNVDPKGNAFSGPFTADIYNPSGGLLQHVAGQIVGQRVTVN